MFSSPRPVPRPRAAALAAARARLSGPLAALARAAGLATLAALLLGLSGCIVVTGNFNPFEERLQPLEETTVQGQGRDKVLILDVSGVITGEEHERPLGQGVRESTVARLKEALRKAEEDHHVRALILRIDSPGGGVTASDVIYQEVKRYQKKTGAPVVASLMDIAASGGYYVALSADEIIAHPTTVTGSVGVIMMNLNVAGLFDKIGVEDTTVVSGPHKDLGSPFRKPTESDRRILQSIVNGMYARFLERVETNRKEIPKDKMKQLTDGRVLTADQALENGFVDKIGYLEEAIDDAKRMAGISEARVVVYNRPDEYAENIYSLEEIAPRPPVLSKADLLQLLGGSGPRFLYLWAPALE